MDSDKTDPVAELSALADACIHCGFCLPACPTYDLWGEEMDSPRGRIHLMKLGLEGEPLTENVAVHMDRCLGCMACVTACPSGVRYDLLISAKRAEVETSRPRSLRERTLRGMIFGLFPYPRRLRMLRGPLRLTQLLRVDRLAATRAARRIAPGLSTMVRIAPRLGKPQPIGEKVLPQGRRRASVGMLLGCVQREFFGDVNAATARVLAAEGCEVTIPRRQGCCGALSLHAGRKDEATAFAKATIATFEAAGVDAVVVNAAGCGSAMKEYADVLADDPEWAPRAQALVAKVRDLSEFLAQLEPVAVRRPLPVAVAYHDACHLSHAQQIRSAPRRLLETVPQLQLRSIPDGETCCGSAGVYNLLQPQTARELGRRKADNVAHADASLLVTSNPGCAMQIAASLQDQKRPMPVAHVAEVVDASIRGLDVADLLRR